MIALIRDVERGRRFIRDQTIRFTRRQRHRDHHHAAVSRR